MAARYGIAKQQLVAEARRAKELGQRRAIHISMVLCALPESVSAKKGFHEENRFQLTDQRDSVRRMSRLRQQSRPSATLG